MKGGKPARVPCRALRLRHRGYGFRSSAVEKLDARILVPRDRHADGLRRPGLGEARDRWVAGVVEDDAQRATGPLQLGAHRAEGLPVHVEEVLSNASPTSVINDGRWPNVWEI